MACSIWEIYFGTRRTELHKNENYADEKTI